MKKKLINGNSENPKSIGYYIQLFYGALFAEYFILEKNKNSTKILYLFWSASSMVLIFAYCCNLRAILSLTELENFIESEEDLIVSDEKLSVTKFQTNIIIRGQTFFITCMVI